MEDKKISIIVPVYNVEKYIDKCLQSLTQQTHKNLEIMLIDDGSPDNSGKICDEWAKKDNRIKVIHKENGGVSSARNLGLEVVTGEYVAFVDPDDYVDLTMYEKMLKSATENNSDMVLCGFKYVFEDGSEKLLVETNLNKVNSGDFLKYYLTAHPYTKNNVVYTDNIMGGVCRSLIKKEAIGETRFPILKIAEDFIFTLKLFQKNINVSVVNEDLYCYLQRQTSAIHNFDKNKITQRLKSFNEISLLVKDKVSAEVLAGFKFYNYASFVHEMLRNKQLKLLNEHMKDGQFRSLNTKLGYKNEIKQIKGFKRKVGYFMVYKKWFKLYSILLKLN